MYIFEIRKKIDWVDVKILFYFYKSDTIYAAYPKWISYRQLNIEKTNKFNTHSIIFKSLPWLIHNKRSLKNLFVAACISFLYWNVNILSNNYLSNLIQNNLLFQTIIIFLTIITFMNLFAPAGFKDNCSGQKIKDVIKNETKNIMKEIEKENRKINSYK